MSFEQPSPNSHFEPTFFPGTQEVAATVVDHAFPLIFPAAIIDHSRKNHDFLEPSAILDGKVTGQYRSQTCAPIGLHTQSDHSFRAALIIKAAGILHAAVAVRRADRFDGASPTRTSRRSRRQAPPGG